MPETDFGMPGMTQIMARPACQRIWHAGDFAGYELLITRTQASRGLGEKVTEPQIMLTGHAKFCCMPISMQNHSGATPSITSEQIIDDRHGKNPCMLTNIENVAEMSSVAESCPKGGFKAQNFLTWMREFSVNNM